MKSLIGFKKGGKGYAEHVPKLLYEDAEHYYPYMVERWGASPPDFGYKDIIPEFQAENWDPDEWALEPAGLRISPPGNLGNGQHAWSFQIVTNTDQHDASAIVSDPDRAMQPFVLESADSVSH